MRGGKNRSCELSLKGKIHHVTTFEAKSSTFVSVSIKIVLKGF